MMHCISRLIQDEGMATLRALEEFFALVRLHMINYVAEFWSLNRALQALKDLISSPCLLIDHIAFFKAHVACIATVLVPYPFLDHLVS